MDSQNSSRHGSQASLLDFDSRQPTQSQSIKPAFDQSQTSFNLTGQSTYPDFSRSQPDIGRPPISQPSPSQSMTTANPNDSKVGSTLVVGNNLIFSPVSLNIWREIGLHSRFSDWWEIFNTVIRQPNQGGFFYTKEFETVSWFLTLTLVVSAIRLNFDNTSSI